jgi:hypothetical protein
MGTVRASRVRRYRSRAADCAACPLKPQCTTARQRAVTRLIDEDARDQVRALAGTEGHTRARRRRKRIERVFGHLKRNLKLRTLKLRGLAGAAEEFTMAAAAYNLQLLANQPKPHPSPAHLFSTASKDFLRLAGQDDVGIAAADASAALRKLADVETYVAESGLALLPGIARRCRCAPKRRAILACDPSGHDDTSSLAVSGADGRIRYRVARGCRSSVRMKPPCLRPVRAARTVWASHPVAPVISAISAPSSRLRRSTNIDCLLEARGAAIFLLGAGMVEAGDSVGGAGTLVGTPTRRAALSVMVVRPASVIIAWIILPSPARLPAAKLKMFVGVARPRSTSALTAAEIAGRLVSAMPVPSPIARISSA